MFLMRFAIQKIDEKKPGIAAKVFKHLKKPFFY